MPLHTAKFAPIIARIRAQAAERDKARRLPYEDIAELAALGFGALRVPLGQGGGGLSVAELSEQLLILAEADSNFVQIFRAHFIFVESLLLAASSPIRDTWLRRIAEGAIIGGAHTERNAVNTDHFATRVHRDGEARWLSGEKYYSTGSLYADWVATLAEGEDDRLTLLAIPKGAPGLATVDDWNGFGQRLTASGTTRFERVAVSAENTLPTFEAFAPYGTSLAQHFHLLGLAGIARAAHAEAVRYVRERTRYFSQGTGALPKDDPVVQVVVGELSSAAYTSEVIVRDIGQRLDTLVALVANPNSDKGQLEALEHDVFRAQQAVTRTVLEAATRLFDVGGASALDADRNWDRFWRNARTLASHNPIGFRLKAIGNYELNGQVALRQWYSGVDLSQRVAK
ncbi:acyl-CoA dehydrogenase family protein [Pseudomonas typographi]|uniref:Oxidoreductase n=1 Tax=Pseudomonas typographi TaxID=2715964 RepID=A0ABR7YWU2_9PSED|nr:acyl-CoA dehydrogenase family protein [Pseudomonas typographi]MBD1552609.1 oxidoreductase [Pseudomonas typographi]MBD1586190.1 oxidoreductase [Pseudomonas typographi]MBD1597661.1 oxidoreductase [Pseudomonas typographi]